MNGPAAAVAPPLVPATATNTHTQTLASYAYPRWSHSHNAHQPPRADRARPAVSRTLCAQTTAVKRRMDRPD